MFLEASFFGFFEIPRVFRGGSYFFLIIFQSDCMFAICFFSFLFYAVP